MKREKDALLEEDEETPTPTTGKKKPVVEEEKKTTANAPVVANGDIIAQTKAILAKKPQVNFIIPLCEHEKPGAFDTVRINGYRLTIKKGEMVTIPLPVAEILANKYKIAMSAGSDKRLDNASKDVSEALE